MRVGLVLAGGAARGAYEVGVVRYVLEEVSTALARDVPIDVLCGTSAGSINAVMLAAHADKPVDRGRLLAQRWTSLKLEDVVRPSAGELLYLAGRLVGRSRDPRSLARGTPRGHLRSERRRGDRARLGVLRPHRRAHARRAALGDLHLDDTCGERPHRGVRAAQGGGRPALGQRSDDGRPRGDAARGARPRVGRRAAALPRGRDRRPVLLRRRPPPERAAVAGAPPRRRRPHRHQPALHPRGVADAGRRPRQRERSTPTRCSSSARR